MFLNEDTETYMEHVTDEASRQNFQVSQAPNESEEDPHVSEDAPLVSIETAPEVTAAADFSSFAQDYPEKLFPLIDRLRPEFRELFIEYYLLGKSQNFLGKTHGCIQTRIWQGLRVIEKAIGALMILGAEPTFIEMRDALLMAGFDQTEYGSLAGLIARYAATQSYTEVAKAVNAPAPAIRKIFRPAIQKLMESSDVKVVAIGAYLRNLTHQSSLKKAGISKQAAARLARMKIQQFTAPPVQNSALMRFGSVDGLKGKPWYMLELSSDERSVYSWGVRPHNYGNQTFNSVLTPYQMIEAEIKKIFGKNSVEVFAPLNDQAELLYGYIFVRSSKNRLPYKTKTGRGIAGYVESPHVDKWTYLIMVEDKDVQDMIRQHHDPKAMTVRRNDFVRILSGPASQYCGIVTTMDPLTVRVDFPTGRQFLVTADRTSVKKLDVPPERRTFWGEIFTPDADHSAPAE